jgi:hypothetical protein
MTDHLKMKLLEAQIKLIEAILTVQTNEQMEAYRAIAEAQYSLVESLLPTVATLIGPVEDGPITMQ